MGQWTHSSGMDGISQVYSHHWWDIYLQAADFLCPGLWITGVLLSSSTLGCLVSRIRPGVFSEEFFFLSPQPIIRLGWHLHNGWIHQPMLHLARHGIPFFGLRLDLAEKDAITCGQTTFDWFTIRDLDPTGTALERKICSVRQKVKDLQGFLQKLGVSGNLSSNLEVCPNKTWGRAWKQGRIDDGAIFCGGICSKMVRKPWDHGWDHHFLGLINFNAQYPVMNCFADGNNSQPGLQSRGGSSKMGWKFWAP